MKRKFYLFLSALLLMLTATTSAWADYGIGDRVKGINDIKDGDLIIIEAASTTDNYGYYIKPTSDDKSYSWQKGYDQTCVWKVIAAGQKSYQTWSKPVYYLQNLANSKFMAGTNSQPTLVDEQENAVTIAAWSENTPWTWATIAPKGWDDNSVALQILMDEDKWLANNPDNRSSGALPNDGSTANFMWNLYKAVDASTTYKIGDRKKSRSDLHNGDLVYIQAASSSLYYDSFIQETNDYQYRWNQGLNKNCVWRLISTGTTNQYYFQNLVSGRYMAGTNTNPETVETADDNCKIDVYDHWTYGYHSYDAGEKPRGWDMYFFELQHHSDWWLGNDGNNHLSDRLFPNEGGIHNIQWNFYEVVIDDGTGEVLNPGQTITNVSDIKPNRAYTLTTTGKGAMEVDVDHEKGMRTNRDYNSYSSGYTQGSLEIGFNQWVFVPTGNVANQYYLYNVASKQYIKADGNNNKLTPDAPDVFTIVKYGNYFKIKAQNSENYLGFKGDDNTLYISSDLTDDSGTQLVIAEAAIFDPSNSTDVTVPTFTLKDKVDYTPPTYSFTASTATYTRTVSNNWGTIVLPFEISASSGVTLYKVDEVQFNGDADGTLTVSEVEGTLAAGTPALFKIDDIPANGEVTFTASDVEIPANIEAGTQSGTGIDLIGKFAKATVTDENTYFINGDKFWGINQSFTVPAFRAYLQTTTKTGNSPSFSIVVDDDPTGIASADTVADTDEIVAVYGVDGTKVRGLQKGINIVRYRSGKTQKVILK